MSGVFERQGIKINRTASLAKVLTKYGFEELKVLLDKKSANGNSGNDDLNNSQTIPVDAKGRAEFFSRIRKVLEDLGPTYVKFGQTLSTREDLFPPELIFEFKKLQDRVPYEDFDVHKKFEEELGLPFEEIFESLEPIPFASASIAQVYKGVLKNKKPIILKVRRPGIQKVVQGDLLLLKDIVVFLHNYYPSVREINLLHVFEAFENNLYQELSFKNELKNIQQFAQNFKDIPEVLNMEAYADLSTDEILCLTYMEGVKINDKSFLDQNNISHEKVFDVILELYLAQILDYGFFHADPHPGNIIVNAQGKVTFIDLGSMGRMYAKDKEHLEDFVIYFINKDAARLVSTIKKMALSSSIQNEKSLERDLLDLFNIISNNSLENIDVKALFSRFSKTLNQNQIIMPEHVYLLVRGIVLIEGIGRELVPGLNIIEKIKPYVKKIVAKRLTPENFLQDNLTTIWELKRILSNSPKTLGKLFEQVQNQEIKILTENKSQEKYFAESKKNSKALPFFILAISFFFFGLILYLGNQFLGLQGFDWKSFFLFLFSLVCFGIYFINYFKIKS